jgi:hypothetical protein
MNEQDDYIKQIAEALKKEHKERVAKHKEEVLDSKQYQADIKYLDDFSWQAIQVIREISIYSTRAKYIYNNFLTINGSDDVMQSILAIRFLVKDGIYNICKREIRYLLEMIVKFLVVDQENARDNISFKIQRLSDNSYIPNSSIEVVNRMRTPFTKEVDKQLKDEIKDIFYKACAYVHPSKRQIEEQLDNYSKGAGIGFQTAKMLAENNKLIFRVYDIILTMLFIGFGESMSGYLFIELYDTNPKWKFHKGKYIKQYSDLFNYKFERQHKNKPK